MALCVFDLDNTLGDFGAIDFFGMIFEPKCLLGYPNITPEHAKLLKNEIRHRPSPLVEGHCFHRDFYRHRFRRFRPGNRAELSRVRQTRRRHPARTAAAD